MTEWADAAVWCFAKISESAAVQFDDSLPSGKHRTDFGEDEVRTAPQHASKDSVLSAADHNSPHTLCMPFVSPHEEF